MFANTHKLAVCIFILKTNEGLLSWIKNKASFHKQASINTKEPILWKQTCLQFSLKRKAQPAKRGKNSLSQSDTAVGQACSPGQAV